MFNRLSQIRKRSAMPLRSVSLYNERCDAEHILRSWEGLHFMKKAILFAASLLLATALTACGGSGGASKAPAVEATGNTVDLAIEATNFTFNEKEYRVKAGDTVNVTFASTEGMHGIDIVGYDVKMKDGDTASFVAQSGEYVIVCNIMCGNGHAQMKSKLIVE
jgi:cytochrome c oxidase subunit 2